MSGDQGARVLHAEPSLGHQLRKIAELPDNRKSRAHAIPAVEPATARAGRRWPIPPARRRERRRQARTRSCAGSSAAPGAARRTAGRPHRRRYRWPTRPRRSKATSRWPRRARGKPKQQDAGQRHPQRAQRQAMRRRPAAPRGRDDERRPRRADREARPDAGRRGCGDRGQRRCRSAPRRYRPIRPPPHSRAHSQAISRAGDCGDERQPRPAEPDGGDRDRRHHQRRQDAQLSEFGENRISASQRRSRSGGRGRRIRRSPAPDRRCPKSGHSVLVKTNSA